MIMFGCAFCDWTKRILGYVGLLMFILGIMICDEPFDRWVAWILLPNSRTPPLTPCLFLPMLVIIAKSWFILSIEIPFQSHPFPAIQSTSNHPNKIIAPVSWVAHKDSSTPVSLLSIADLHTHRNHRGTSWSGWVDQRVVFCCECPLFWADGRSCPRSASIPQ